MDAQKTSAFSSNKKTLIQQFKKAWGKYWEIYILLIPLVVYYIIFAYYPMYGIQIAFRDFMPLKGITGSPWAGFKYFQRFIESPYLWPILRNTIAISLYSLVVGFPLPILFALLLNHLRSERFKKTVQTVSYAPHFISTVVFVGMLKLMLSPETGVINLFLIALKLEPIYFFGRADLFYGLYVWSGVWQELGWSAIIYVGALAGINQELYEAAKIDGATIWHQIWHIDIPGILPTITILLIMRAGSLLGVGYEKAYLMQNTMNSAMSEVISTYTYKQGLLSAQHSYAAAVGLMNTVVNFVFLVLVNWIAGKTSDTSLF